MNNISTPIEHKVLSQNGYSIHYYTSGSLDNKLIVFLHPAFTNHHSFDKQIDFFSQHFRVITIDLLGHGLSQVTKSDDKIDISAEHINAIMLLEGFDNAHFVGVSMGSLIAQYFAYIFPKKVLSLTVLGGYDINNDNKEISKAQRREGLKWILMAVFSMKSFRKYVSSVSVSTPEEQENFYQMTNSFTRKSFRVMPGLSKVVRYREKIERNYPLLILYGDKDLELLKRMCKEWSRTEPESDFAIIGNAGHCANMDNAVDFNQTLFKFIKKNE